MRVRALSPTGDMTFGRGRGNYLINSPEAVGQVAKTRLELWLGQWFLNRSDGTPWATEVLGYYTAPTRNAAIEARLAGTPGVVAVTGFQSQFNAQTRTFAVQATLQTIYGKTTLAIP